MSTPNARLFLAVLAAVLFVLPAAAQTGGRSSGVDTTPVRLSGPRVGVTYVTGNRVFIRDDGFGGGFGEEVKIPLVFSQFGWQFERRMFTTEGGLSGVTEFVPLVGGLEQGIVLPSLTFLVGLRTPAGTELGIGPNLSATGVAYAIGAGVTRQYSGVNVPVNVSAVLSDRGVRFSLLTGFTIGQ